NATAYSDAGSARRAQMSAQEPNPSEDSLEQTVAGLKESPPPEPEHQSFATIQPSSLSATNQPTPRKAVTPVGPDAERLAETGPRDAERWETAGLAVGQTILHGGYRVEKFLDRGGMGEVWQVRHLHMDRLQVLKLIHARFAVDSESIRRFNREAKV